MTHLISLKNWNDGKSAFYNFYNWVLNQPPRGKTERETVDILLNDYGARIIYINGTGHLTFNCQEDMITFILRWT